MSRWAYNTDTVTVGPNSLKVRQLTWGEQTEYAEKFQKGGDQSDLPALIVGFGAIDPPLTKEDIQLMPPELLQACFKRILELTGVNLSDKPDDETATTPRVEKKETSLPATS